MDKLLRILILIGIIALFSCQVDPNQIANKSNMYKELHTTKYFKITSYTKKINYTKHNKPIHVYIEGDGQAWISKYKLSGNPTPLDPLTLKLASLDRNSNVIYIARPCQFTPLELDRNCSSKYWSTARYSLEVVESINEVITNFKMAINHPNQEIHLIGYSGGATIAGIIASIRHDVKSITTIAGNLDHDAVSDFHKTTKLDQSLNLIDFAKDISHIKQTHYIGENDQIIPTYVVKDFVAKINGFNKSNIAKFIILKNVDHYHGWLPVWNNLCNQGLL